MEGKTIVWIVVIMSMCVLAATAFFLTSCRAKSMGGQGLNRGDYVKRITELEIQYQNNRNREKVRLEYARNLFEVGEFSKSQELLKPLLDRKNPPADAIYFSGYIDYLQGHYLKAEKMFESLIENASAKRSIDAQLGLFGTYYQTNRYEKASNLFKGLEGKIQLPLWTMMKAFGDEKPYQIEWKGKNRVVVPFVVTDPLPVISVEINGKQIYIFIDTGADLFYLDDTVASSLGIKSIARQIEPYAGGKTVEVGYGRADSLKIGDMIIKSIPIKLGPIQRCSSVFDNTIAISGIMSTNDLHQFLATMDYPANRLILRPRNDESRKGLKNEFTKTTVTEIPFVLAMTHLMIGKGSINGREGLNVFFDSGLADSTAAVLLPEQTMELLGIPIPATTETSAIGGLAGGGFPIGRFPVGNIGIGPLRQDSLQGIYGVFPGQLYHMCDFLVDGLISHRFLKKYAWTIDFDSMKMLFAM